MSLPMPAHERFYQGTEWKVAAGPMHWVGLKVIVTGEVFSRDDELWVEVTAIGHPDEQFEACLSWLS